MLLFLLWLFCALQCVEVCKSFHVEAEELSFCWASLEIRRNYPIVHWTTMCHILHKFARLFRILRALTAGYELFMSIKCYEIVGALVTAVLFHQPLCDQGQCWILLGSPSNSFINAAGFAPLDNGICARDTTSNWSSEEAESINSPGDDKQ